MVLRPPPSLSSNAPINRFLRGAGGSDFFYRFSSHLIISRLLACVVAFATRLPSYPYRPAPLPVSIDTIGGEVHGCDTVGGGGDVVLASCGDGWQREGRSCGDGVLCLISLARFHA